MCFTIGLGVVGMVLSLVVPALHGEHSGLFLIDQPLLRRPGGLVGLLIVPGWCCGSCVAEAVLKKSHGFGDVKFCRRHRRVCVGRARCLGVRRRAVGTVWLRRVVVAKNLGKASPRCAAFRTPEGEPTALGFGAQVHSDRCSPSPVRFTPVFPWLGRRVVDQVSVIF